MTEVSVRTLLTTFTGRLTEEEEKSPQKELHLLILSISGSQDRAGKTGFHRRNVTFMGKTQATGATHTRRADVRATFLLPEAETHAESEVKSRINNLFLS